MPSPFVILEPDLLARLRQTIRGLQALLEPEQMYADVLDSGSIAININAFIHAPAAAAPFNPNGRGITFCRPGFGGEHRVRLGDDDIVFLLDHLSNTIARHGELTGHERADILQAIDVAKTAPRPALIQTAPAILTARQQAMREQAMPLAATLAPELQALDLAAEAYGHLAGGSFLEGAIASLSLQVDVGLALLLGNARTYGGMQKATLLPAPGRKPGSRYQAATQAVDCLEMKATRLSPLFPGPVKTAVNWDLVSWLHQMTFEGTLARPGEVRETMIVVRRAGGDALGETLPPAEIEPAMIAWSSDFGREAWRDFHWLIRIGLAHLAFERIHPFADGNGRIGRLVMLLQMIEVGAPMLPSEAAINKRRAVYLATLDQAIAGGDPEPFLRFLISACQEAIRLGQELLPRLLPIQHRMTAAISETDLPFVQVPHLASLLLGRVLLDWQDFGFVFNTFPEDIVGRLEASGMVRRIAVDHRWAWIVPGLPEALQEVFT